MNQYLSVLNFINNEDYENFCLAYTKAIATNSHFSVDLVDFENLSPSKSLKYIEFMLYKNPHNYNVSYIDYLIENNFSPNIIYFLEALKSSNEPQGIMSELIITDYVALLIEKKKDEKLFDYLLDNPLKDWSTYSSSQVLFNHLALFDYNYSLNRFYDKAVNPHYHFIDLFNTMSVSKLKEKKYSHFEKLEIKNPDLLLDIIASQSNGIYFDYSTIAPKQTGRSGVMMAKSRSNLKSKASEVWLKYSLECELSEKIKTKSSKI